MHAHNLMDTGHAAGLSAAQVVFDGTVARHVAAAEGAYAAREARSVRELGAMLRAERAETARLRAALAQAQARANRAEATVLALTGA